MADSLCETCRHMRVVRTTRSRFFLCELSLANPECTKYPWQPVVRSPGCRPWATGDEPGTVDPPDGRS